MDLLYTRRFEGFCLVTSDSEASDIDLKVRFVVQAELLCDPVSVAVQFVADVELDSGKIVIGRL